MGMIPPCLNLMSNDWYAAWITKVTQWDNILSDGGLSRLLGFRVAQYRSATLAVYIFQGQCPDWTWSRDDLQRPSTTCWWGKNYHGSTNCAKWKTMLCSHHGRNAGSEHRTTPAFSGRILLQSLWTIRACSFPNLSTENIAKKSLFK